MPTKRPTPPKSNMLRAYDAIFSADRDRLDTRERMVMLALARHLGGQDWLVWPGLGKLVKMTGYARSTVQEVRRSIISKGLAVDRLHPARSRSGEDRVFRGIPTLCLELRIEAIETLATETTKKFGTTPVLVPPRGTPLYRNAV